MGGSSLYPRAYQAEFKTSVRLRFSNAVAVTNGAVSQVDILDLVCMAVLAGQVNRVFAAARVRSVELWAPAAAAGIATVSVDWTGTGNFSGPRQLIADTSLGTTMPAHVFSRPPSNSLASMWFIDGSTGGTLFTLNLPANSVVDVVIDYVVRNSEGAQACTAAVAGATPGRMYVRRLDSTGGSLLIPVLMNTI